MTTLPTCPREDCTFTGPHHDHNLTTGKVRDHSHDGDDCGHWETARHSRCYAPRTPQPKPAAVVLPTVDECRTAIREAWAAENAIGSGPRVAAQAVLDLIAARLPVWHPVEPGTVIKAGTRMREIRSDGDTTEWTATADFARSPSSSHVFIDQRTVPAEPEDPALAVVVDYFGTSDENARDLLARIDAARSDHA